MDFDWFLEGKGCQNSNWNDGIITTWALLSSGHEVNKLKTSNLIGAKYRNWCGICQEILTEFLVSGNYIVSDQQ